MKLTQNALITAMSQDRALASAILFKHRHPQDSPPAHVEVLDAFCSQDELVMVSAFREFGKSSLMEEFIILEALYGNFNYAVLLGNSFEKATQRLEAIKMELAGNAKITQLFGSQKLATSKWNESTIVLPNGTMIEARGFNTELRGMKWGAHRPDRFICDDVEDSESVRNKAAVDATLAKIYREILPAMDRIKGKLRVVGTPLAQDCLVSRLSANPEWKSLFYPIVNGDPMAEGTKSLWPERYPLEWVQKTYERYTLAGQGPIFSQEFMLEAVDAQNKVFDASALAETPIDPAPWLPKTVLIDPARTANAKTSDRTGYVVVSKLGNKIFVHESAGQFWEPSEIIAACFDLSAKYGGARVAIEKNSLDLFLTAPIRAEMLRRGTSLNLKTLLAPSNMGKNDFISGLQPFINASDVVLIGGAKAHAQLVSEIAMFPSGKRDVINALAYTLKVYSDVPVYADFTQAHTVADYVVAQGTPLALAFNAGQGETTAALCAVAGERLVVLADWVSPQAPVEAVGDIMATARAMYPRRQIEVWVPGDVYEQKDRVPLMHAMNVHKLRPAKGALASLSRAELSSLLRTESKGTKLFLVDHRATHTANAMAQGYCYALSSSLQQGGEPEKNPSRTLMEGIETMANVIYGREKATPIIFNARANGQSYFSSAPQSTRKRV